MMDERLAIGGGEPVVVVTVAATEGSAPRDAGARMLVAGTAVSGTIGGGHLEFAAIRMARDMLAAGEGRRVERFALGPSLGQCCGGAVRLVFDLADPTHVRRLAQGAAGEAAWRLVALDGARESHLVPAHGDNGLGLRLVPRTRVVADPGGRRWLADYIGPAGPVLFLFGAGHVGRAMVAALAPLPCRVTWVDEREDAFPAAVPPNVAVEATDIPEAVAASAPPRASYLVMTHSHALDLRIAEAILARGDALWFGLIGSKTKRAQFDKRLRARGFDEARIGTMACPIGMPGITGKEPAVIAASTCAQLLAVWEAQRAARP